MNDTDAKIGIYIPCYNVEKTIAKVLEAISEHFIGRLHRIVLVDNKSSDQSVKVMQECINKDTSLKNKAVILEHTENFGLGGSQKTAYRYLIDSDCTHFFILHGDNQGEALSIADRFFKSFDEAPDIDFIFACRFHQDSDLSAYSKKRIFANIFFNILTWMVSGLKMNDAGTGIIFYKTSSLKNFPYQELTNSFQFNPQLNLLLFSEPNYNIKQIPLDWGDTEAGSNVNEIRYAITLFRILILYKVRKLMGKKGSSLFYPKPEAFHYSFKEISASS